MTYLGLDMGSELVGLSLSHGDIVSEFGVLKFDGGDYIDDLKKIIEQQKVDIIVIGIPLKSDGSLSKQGEWINDQIKRIKQATNIPIELTEESYTSSEAKRQLPPNVEKARIDSFSAKLILEQYLNESRSK